MTRDEAIDTLVRQLQDRSKPVRDVRAVYRRGKSEVVIERQNIVETIGLHRDFGEHHIPGLVEKYTPEWEVSAAPVAGAVLTARETITYFGELHGMDAAAIRKNTDRLIEALGMKDFNDRRTEGFSQGERMKTALARALVHDPANIILDEPTNGLDVLATRALRESLRRLRDEHGKCIVFSTHIMQEVAYLCDRVVLVSHGRTVAEGTVDELNARAAQTDFGENFVHLALTDEEPTRGDGA